MINILMDEEHYHHRPAVKVYELEAPQGDVRLYAGSQGQNRVTVVDVDERQTWGRVVASIARAVPQVIEATVPSAAFKNADTAREYLLAGLRHLAKGANLILLCIGEPVTFNAHPDLQAMQSIRLRGLAVPVATDVLDFS